MAGGGIRLCGQATGPLPWSPQQQLSRHPQGTGPSPGLLLLHQGSWCPRQAAPAPSSHHNHCDPTIIAPLLHRVVTKPNPLPFPPAVPLPPAVPAPLRPFPSSPTSSRELPFSKHPWDPILPPPTPTALYVDDPLTFTLHTIWPSPCTCRPPVSGSTSMTEGPQGRAVRALAHETTGQKKQAGTHAVPSTRTVHCWEVLTLPPVHCHAPSMQYVVHNER